MAKTLVCKQANFFTDGKHFAELNKCAGGIYEVRYYTRNGQVQVKAYPSKSAAMQFVNYFVDEQADDSNAVVYKQGANAEEAYKRIMHVFANMTMPQEV